MKLASTRMMLFNAAGVVIGVSVSVGLLRPLFIPPTPTPSSQRYQQSMSLQLARGGVMLSAADLEASLDGKDSGVIDNLAITAEKKWSRPHQHEREVAQGRGIALSAADRKGGMSFPGRRSPLRPPRLPA